MSQQSVPPVSLAELRAEAVDSFGPAADRVIPDVRQLSASFAYGMVWSRPGLGTRERCIATIAAVAAINCPQQLRVHVVHGLANGVTKEEIGEVFTQLIPYVGFPLSVSAAAAVADLVERAQVPASDGT